MKVTPLHDPSHAVRGSQAQQPKPRDETTKPARTERSRRGTDEHGGDAVEGGRRGAPAAVARGLPVAGEPPAVLPQLNDEPLEHTGSTSPPTDPSLGVDPGTQALTGREKPRTRVIWKAIADHLARREWRAALAGAPVSRLGDTRGPKTQPLGTERWATTGPTEEHVQQGGVGSCWYLATLASIARVQPEFLKSMFRRDPETGRLQVRFFRLELDLPENYDPARLSFEFGSAVGCRLAQPMTEHWITVDETGLGEGALETDLDKDGIPENGIALLEKAYADFMSEMHADFDTRYGLPSRRAHIAEMCERLGRDVTELASGLGIELTELGKEPVTLDQVREALGIESSVFDRVLGLDEETARTDLERMAQEQGLSMEEMATEWGYDSVEDMIEEHRSWQRTRLENRISTGRPQIAGTDSDGDGALQSYENIEGGWPETALMMVTGTSVTSEQWDDPASVDKEKVWGLLGRANNDIPVVAVAMNPEQESGIPGAHAYSVLGTVEVPDAEGKPARYVVLRNPWGRTETEFEPPVAYRSVDDGVYLLRYDEFIENFSHVSASVGEPGEAADYPSLKEAMSHHAPTERWPEGGPTSRLAESTGRIDNRGFLEAMKRLAEEDPDLLRNMIREDPKTGRTQVGFYATELDLPNDYDPESLSLRDGLLCYEGERVSTRLKHPPQRVWIDVDEEGLGRGGVSHTDVDGDQIPEIGLAMIERAYADYMSDMNAKLDDNTYGVPARRQLLGELCQRLGKSLQDLADGLGVEISELGRQPITLEQIGRALKLDDAALNDELGMGLDAVRQDLEEQVKQWGYSSLSQAAEDMGYLSVDAYVRSEQQRRRGVFEQSLNARARISGADRNGDGRVESYEHLDGVSQQTVFRAVAPRVVSPRA